MDTVVIDTSLPPSMEIRGGIRGEICKMQLPFGWLRRQYHESGHVCISLVTIPYLESGCVIVPKCLPTVVAGIWYYSAWSGQVPVEDANKVVRNFGCHGDYLRVAPYDFFTNSVVSGAV
jgi:hypothetical protein